MEALTGLALAAPAGLNAYIPLLAAALAQRFGWLSLREPFDLLGSWWAIGLITALLVIEIVADKIPAVDHINDGIQTFLRPVAGGVLAFATSYGRVSPAFLVAAGVLLAGGMHAAKATARPAINVATGGTGAPVASTAEDVGAVGLSALAIIAPFIALVIVAALLGLALWALVKLRERARAHDSPPPT